MYKKICIWGDSIAYGYSDLEKGGWVDRLKTRYLLEDGISFYNLGVSGDTTDDLLKRFDNEAETREPSIIIFAIGINDSVYLKKENKFRVLKEKFKDNVFSLIIKSRKHANDIVFIGANPVDEDKVTPIPWDPQANKNYYNKNIKKYNRILNDIVKEENLIFIDIYNEFLKNTDYKKLLHDGLHPNSQGHQLIFETVKKELNL